MSEQTRIDHRVDRDGPVVTITLERPQARNALTVALVRSLVTTFESIEEDETVRAIVLTGAGKAFCAGQALDDEETLPRTAPHRLIEAIGTGYNPLVLAIMTSVKPVVAAIEGVAAGGGFGIACACDFRVVAEDAVFTSAFVRLGLVPDCSLSFTLPRIVGYGRAAQMCMLSERIDAHRADAFGLCTKLVPSGQAVTEALALAKRLAAGPSLATGLIKRELRENGYGEIRDALDREMQLQEIASASPDFVEGLAAFREKRGPSFSPV